jgi:hypothetical protein
MTFALYSLIGADKKLLGLGFGADMGGLVSHCFPLTRQSHQWRYSQRQSLGSKIPDLIKDDSFVLISSLSGPNDLDEEICSLIGCSGGQAYDSSQ